MIAVLYFVLLKCLLVMGNLQLLVILPLNSSTNSCYDNYNSNSYERGLELLVGAKRAVEIINSDLDLLFNHTIEMVVINSKTCSSRQTGELILPQLLNATVHNAQHLISAVGFFCPNTAKLLVNLVQNKKNELKFPLFIGSLSPVLQRTDLPPNLHYLVDSSLVIVKALVNFMEHQRWTRVAVITDYDDTYYFQTANTFLQYIKMHTKISVSMHEQVSLCEDVFLEENFDARVIFVSVSLSAARKIMKLAIKNKWIWPTHVWIFHTHSVNDFPIIDKHTHSDLTSLNGMFFFQDTLLKNKPILKFDHLYPGLGAYCKASNPYASILCQSIIISALLKNAKNASLAELHHSNDSDVVLGLANDSSALFTSGVDLIIVLGGEPIMIGHYDTDLVIVNQSLLSSSEIPPSEIYHSPSTLTLLVFYTEITICFTLVTANLVLYVYYRNEPEVKATSFTITMIIFVSCYIMMLYLVLLASEQFNVLMSAKVKCAICLARSWINLIGIPGPLIVATVLIKMLRVYRIFRPNNFVRIGKLFSDPAVLCYILALQVPNVLVTLLWSTLDPYKNDVSTIKTTNSIQVLDTCKSKNIVLWPMMLMAYFILLDIVLITVAIKTRKIRKMHFKDTKKVNLLVYMIIILTIFLMSTWIITRIVSKTVYAELILHIGHTFMILITQGLLILPKIYPPLRRHVQRTKSKKLGSVTSHDSSTLKTSYKKFAILESVKTY